jgi:hypothetical protein
VIDSKSIGTFDGFDIVAEVWPDYDTSPEDYDDEMFTEKQRDAYYRGEWAYCGLVITANLRGFRLGKASLWGLEYGWLPESNDERYLDPLVYMADDLQDLIDEAVADANTEFSALVSAR